MGRGRPGGNPNLREHQFTNDGRPARNKVLSIRVTEEELTAIRNFFGDRCSEQCRDIILNQLQP
jgi:hypothetical protein